MFGCHPIGSNKDLATSKNKRQKNCPNEKELWQLDQQEMTASWHWINEKRY